MDVEQIAFPINIRMQPLAINAGYESDAERELHGI